VEQGDRRALLGRQAGDRRPQPRCGACVSAPVFGRLLRQLGGDGGAEAARRGAAADGLGAAPRNNPVGPGAEGAAVGEARQAADDLRPGVLHRVARGLAIAQQAHRMGEEPGLPALH
jgi:hypothetical protein